jgi:ABC-type antimicrobial peptide transport system permease subunit
MPYAAVLRTGEIGIRMALGAQRRKIIAMVLREVLALTAAGLLIGYVAARFTTHLVESFLLWGEGQRPMGRGSGAGGRVRTGVASVADRPGDGIGKRIG